MPTTYKILGQITGSSNTGSLSSVYTVPGATQAVVSSLVAANRSVNNTQYYIAVIPSGQTIEDKHYVAYNIPISGSDSTALTLGITLGAGDSIQVTGLATGSFSVFGSEIS
jgi:hypothetical protein